MTGLNGQWGSKTKVCNASEQPLADFYDGREGLPCYVTYWAGFVYVKGVSRYLEGFFTKKKQWVIPWYDKKSFWKIKVKV